MKKHKSILFFENLHERINYNERIINKFNDLKCLLRDLDICIEKLKSEYNCNPCLLLKSKLDIYNDKRDKYVDMFNQYDKNIKKNKVLDYYNKDKDFLEIANNFNSIISSLKKIENDSKKLKCKSIFSGYMVEVYSSDGRKKYIHSSLIDEYERLFNLKKEILPLYNVKLSDYSNRYSEYYINDYFNDELFDSIKDNDSFDLDFASDLFDKYYSDMTLDEKIRYNVYTMDKILNDKNFGKKQFITVDGKKYYIPVKMKNWFIICYGALKKLKEISNVNENISSDKNEECVNDKDNSLVNKTIESVIIDDKFNNNSYLNSSHIQSDFESSTNNINSNKCENSIDSSNDVFYNMGSKNHKKSAVKNVDKVVYEVLSVKPVRNYNELFKNIVAISLSLITSLSYAGVVRSLVKKYNNYSDNYSLISSKEVKRNIELPFNNSNYKTGSYLDNSYDYNTSLYENNMFDKNYNVFLKDVNNNSVVKNDSNGSYKNVNIENSEITSNDNVKKNKIASNDNVINSNSIDKNLKNSFVKIDDVVTVRYGSKIYCNVYDAMTKSNAKNADNPYSMERSVIGIFVKYNHKFIYSTNQSEIDELLSNGGVIKSYVIGNGGYEGAFHSDDVVKVKSLVR